MTTTLVESTGSAHPADVTAINTAIGAASSDDIIQLKQKDDATPFDLGTKAQGAGIRLGTPSAGLAKTLTLEGVPINGVLPKFVGGKHAILVDNADNDIHLKNLHLHNFNIAALTVRKIRNFSMVGCKLNCDTAVGKTVPQTFAGESENRMYIVNFGLKGALLDKCTGEILFQDNEIDPQMDSAQYPGADLNLFIWGMVFRGLAKTSQLRCVNNVIKNFTTRGIVPVDCWGATELLNNTYEHATFRGIRADGKYSSAKPWAGAAVCYSQGVVRGGNPDGYGSFSAEGNLAVINAGDQSGFRVMSYKGWKRSPASYTSNTVRSNDEGARACFETFGQDRTYLGQNKLEGAAKVGFLIGASNSRVFGCDHNAVVGNNVTKLSASEAMLILGYDAWYNGVAGGGFTPESVINLGGETNKVTGYAPIGGELGQYLSDILTEVHDGTDDDGEVDYVE